MYKWRDQWTTASPKPANIVDLQDLEDGLRCLMNVVFGCYIEGNFQMRLCTVYIEFPKDSHYRVKSVRTSNKIYRCVIKNLPNGATNTFLDTSAIALSKLGGFSRGKVTSLKSDYGT